MGLVPMHANACLSGRLHVRAAADAKVAVSSAPGSWTLDWDEESSHVLVQTLQQRTVWDRQPGVSELLRRMMQAPGQGSTKNGIPRMGWEGQARACASFSGKAALRLCSIVGNQLTRHRLRLPLPVVGLISLLIS